MANSAAASVVVVAAPSQDIPIEKRKIEPEPTSQNKRVKVDTKAAGLWVQRSIQLGGQAKPVLRKSASVNNLWVKQSIAFVSRDV
ncbi:unnamed protein product [Aphanomyces euteiches]|uniref:Uncharacterized protein n=1 Tax=Aphanomyces euteiches TaxID=100861 RepID=A0A6G0XDJ6_9STRA|nr:hypothetical protein Ae201684_005854 [Aphanomyces euteiches]KAH9078165.1 hypothetical protein Ae201684P_019262 [Aphanomyces euteiches]KAH9136990.1 hypothetical protein AeRB84_018102 [Aphanomyces euteiches]KAH9193293.1 hypothetical protein AeNC1_004719 [Aphanomyces euteiches]